MHDRICPHHKAVSPKLRKSTHILAYFAHTHMLWRTHDMNLLSVYLCLSTTDKQVMHCLNGRSHVHNNSICTAMVVPTLILLKPSQRSTPVRISCLPGLICASPPKRYSRLLPKQKCSIILNISAGLVRSPYSGSSVTTTSRSTLA